MSVYIRILSIEDLDRCQKVEQSAFPPAEAATREKIEYRLSVCPELCYGLFARAGSSNTQTTARTTLEIETGSEDDELIAHTISTRSETRVVKDQDMVVANNWKSDPKADHGEGHRPNGRSIALHALAVSPARQRSGFGKALMKAYIEQMRHEGDVDRISILTYDWLVPYYKKLGFTHYGKSASEYAGIAWHDLGYEYNTPGASSSISC